MLGVKQTQDTPASLPQDQQEGVDEEEWVREMEISLLFVDRLVYRTRLKEYV